MLEEYHPAGVMKMGNAYAYNIVQWKLKICTHISLAPWDVTRKAEQCGLYPSENTSQNKGRSFNHGFALPGSEMGNYGQFCTAACLLCIFGGKGWR